MGTEEDREIRRLLRGSRDERDEAIRKINSRHKRYIWGTIRKIAPNLSTSDVVDIYQEVFLTIISIANKKDGFCSDVELKPYIGAITHNKTIDWLRKITRMSKLKDNLRGALEGSDCQENHEPSNENEIEFMLNDIREAIAKMPIRQRQTATIIVDHFPEKLTNRKIATILSNTYGEQCSEQAVKRARQEMQKKVTTILKRKKREASGYARS